MREPNLSGWVLQGNASDASASSSSRGRAGWMSSPSPGMDPSATEPKPLGRRAQGAPRAGTRRAQEGAAPAKGTRCHSHFHPAQLSAAAFQGKHFPSGSAEEACLVPAVLQGDEGGLGAGRAPQKFLSPLPAPSSPLCSTWLWLGVFPPPCPNSWWSRA